MKNKLLLIFLILFITSACQKDNAIKGTLLGTWLQVDWNTKLADPSSYVKFYNNYKMESTVLNLGSYDRYGTTASKLILFRSGSNLSLSNTVTVVGDTLTIIPDTYCVGQYGHGCSTLYVKQK